VKDWDFAPAHLILEEAGGVICNITGGIFNYQDSYERNGLIATKSMKAKEEVLAFFSNK
jgi:3'-phosphoadenosine 5'-phosphosulfate (PAPS) 3'-phosphatase